MNREHLEQMTVAQLRDHARANSPHIKGTDVIRYSKANLISAILGESVQSAPVAVETTGGNNELETLRRILGGSVNTEQVNAIIDNRLADTLSMIDNRINELAGANKPLTIEVKTGDTVKTLPGAVHYTTPGLIKLASARKNIFLVGPAGSGKTTACHKVADALELPFYFISVGAQTTKSDLLGYNSANGQYVSTLLREAYENGGVFLLDEIDAGNANVLTVINAMLANGVASFPDKMVKRHKDFIFFAAGNTYAIGNDRQYVGRNAIDAATRNRFWFFDFGYDEKLELAISPNPAFTKIVQNVRARAAELKERIIVSPRASLSGDMLQHGFTVQQVLDATVFQGINDDVKTKILAGLSLEI